MKVNWLVFSLREKNSCFSEDSSEEEWSSWMTSSSFGITVTWLAMVALVVSIPLELKHHLDFSCLAEESRRSFCCPGFCPEEGDEWKTFVEVSDFYSSYTLWF